MIGVNLIIINKEKIGESFTMKLKLKLNLQFKLKRKKLTNKL